MLQRSIGRVAAEGSAAVEHHPPHIDLPGVKAESLDITIERNVLTIAAERNWQRQETDQLYFGERYRVPSAARFNSATGSISRTSRLTCTTAY